MGQDYTALLQLRGRVVDLDALLAFQRGYGLSFAGSNMRWGVLDGLVRLEAAARTDVAGFAADLASTSASRHAEFAADGFALGLGFLDRDQTRSALLTITERQLTELVAALSPRGADLLTYLAALADQLDASSLVLGLDLGVAELDAFLRGQLSEQTFDGAGVQVASGVPDASEHAMRAHARVRETELSGRRLLFSWLPGHERHFR